MDNSFHTSFIPKKPVVNTQIKRREPLGILSFVSATVILLTIVAIVGLYFYKDYLNKEIASKKNSLALARESLEEKTLVELQTFDRRINSSKEVISKHIVLSPFFSLLNSLTLPQVQFTNFSGFMSEDGKGFFVSMPGLAKDYKTVAIQSDILNSDQAKELSEVLFTDLSLSDEKNTKGYVAFNLSFFVNPSFISFENNVLQNKNMDKLLETDLLQTVPDVSSTVGKIKQEQVKTPPPESQNKTFNKLPQGNNQQ